ncbi:MAG: hypothetical protein ACREMY_11005, partial [bacterium]
TAAGLNPTPLPEDFESLTGSQRCLAVAMDLLAAAATDEPPLLQTGNELDQILLINSPSLERSDLPWVNVLRVALDKGWTVFHVLSPESNADRRIERVRSLFSLVLADDRYVPVMLPWEPSAAAAAAYSPAEVIVAPGKGVLQLFSGAAAATYFPWSGPFQEACRHLAKDAHSAQTTGSRIITAFRSTGSASTLEAPDKEGSAQPNEFLSRLPGKVVFDTALTNAVARGGRRALMKSGLVLATMPPYATLKFTARMKQSAVARGQQELIPMIDILASNRMRRWESVFENPVDPYHHICTIAAIRSYLSRDTEKERDAWLYQHDPLYSGTDLTQEDRLAHMKGVIELLRSSARYEVGLVESPDALPIPVGESYWFATTEGLFYVGGQHGSPDTRYVMIRESAVVDGFLQLFDGVWESIPAPMRDRQTVANWLQGLVTRAESGEEMMKAVFPDFPAA